MKKNSDMFFLSLQQKNDKIEFNINCQSDFPYQCYWKEFSLNDLTKISKYFQLFDSLDECFNDLKQKLDENNYEMILNNINEKIILKFKINIANKDFNLDIPFKKLEQEKIYFKIISPYPKSNFNYYNNDEPSAIKYFEKIDKYFDEKLKIYKNIKDNLEIENENEQYIKNKSIKLFEKSTIIENDYERRLLEFFIKENDKTKKEIYPILIFKSSIDGDASKKFHEKCDFCGATLTIVRSDIGKRFGGYSSISWDKGIGNYISKGDNFLFSLDTRKYYKNTSGNYHTYHNEGYGPTFGSAHDLYISNGCMSNQNSYTNKTDYDRTSAYELNGGVYKFKVLDYEVYKI